MRVLVWLVRALLFFCLFAFALNNQHTVTVHGFFGHALTAPLVIVVLAAFALGAALGMLALAPAWWHQREAAQQARSAPPPASTSPAALSLHPPQPD